MWYNNRSFIVVWYINVVSHSFTILKLCSSKVAIQIRKTKPLLLNNYLIDFIYQVPLRVNIMQSKGVSRGLSLTEHIIRSIKRAVRYKIKSKKCHFILFPFHVCARGTCLANWLHFFPKSVDIPSNLANRILYQMELFFRLKYSLKHSNIHKIVYLVWWSTNQMTN